MTTKMEFESAMLKKTCQKFQEITGVLLGSFTKRNERFHVAKCMFYFSYNDLIHGKQEVMRIA